jgi:SAM-dependent methyltransferase
MKKAPRKRTITAMAPPPVDALAAFEALVQRQVPAGKPWEPVTDYQPAARYALEAPQVPLLLDHLTPHRVLDAGCGPGHLVRLLCEAGLDAYGCDLQSYTAWLGSPRFGYAALDDVNGIQPFTGSFDLVICREVLEHLTILQLRQAVRNLCRWTTKYVYVTTRFHPAPTHLLDVATIDDLDPTHITLLNQDLLRALFVLEGLTRRADLEAILDWKKVGRVLVYAK